MQYIRERLSLNLSSNNQTNGSFEISNGSTQVSDTPDTPPKPPARKHRDGVKLSEVIISPTISTISESLSQQGSTLNHSKTIDASGSTLESTYATPFQSPVASEKWSPHNASTTSDENVYFKNQNQFNGYPTSYSTPIAGGYVNHSFVDGTGSTASNPAHPNQAHVIHEHYWTWSCKCRRQFTNREKVLLLVICFLLLIIGGLAAYLGLSNNGNPLQGGLLTPGVLQVRKAEIEYNTGYVSEPIHQLIS